MRRVTAAAAFAALGCVAMTAHAQTTNPNTVSSAAPNQPNATAGVEAGNVATASREVTSAGQSDHVGAGLRKPNTKLTFKGKIASGIPGLDSSFQKTIDLKDLLKRKPKASAPAVTPPPVTAPAKLVRKPLPVKAKVAASAPAQTTQSQAAAPEPVQPKPAAQIVPPPVVKAPPPKSPLVPIVTAALAIAAIGAVIAAFMHAAIAEAAGELLSHLRPPRIRAEARAGESQVGAPQFDDHAHVPAIGVIVRPGRMTTQFSFIEPQERT